MTYEKESATVKATPCESIHLTLSEKGSFVQFRVSSRACEQAARTSDTLASARLQALLMRHLARAMASDTASMSRDRKFAKANPLGLMLTSCSVAADCKNWRRHVGPRWRRHVGPPDGARARLKEIGFPNYDEMDVGPTSISSHFKSIVNFGIENPRAQSPTRCDQNTPIPF